MVRSTEVTAVMQKFVAQINAHDPFGIMSLCTVDHVFIDSLGSRVSGRERLQQAWTGYFALFPNYHIELESAASQGTLALPAVSPPPLTRHRKRVGVFRQHGAPS